MSTDIDRDDIRSLVDEPVPDWEYDGGDEG